MRNSIHPLRQVATLFAAAILFGLSLANPASAQIGPIAGKPNDGTPKPGVYLTGGLRYGRLVDIWALDSQGNPGPITKKSGATTIADPLYLDTVIAENIGISKTQTSGTVPAVSLTLKRDAISGSVALVIGAPFNKSPKSPFQLALKEVTQALGTIAAGGPTSLPPFSQVPRDAAIVLKFDRALNPKTIGPESIRLYVGTATAQGNLPPTPFLARYIWKAEDPKTVIIDMTINAVDDSRISDGIDSYNTNSKNSALINPQVLPINTLGLPASQTSTTFNAAIFIPAQYNIVGGVTKVLLAKDGTSLDVNKSATKFNYYPKGGSTGNSILGVARVFRAGGSTDANQGFLSDPTSPQILGSQQILVQSVSDVLPGDQRLVTFKYLNDACNLTARVGDSLQQGSAFATVSSVDPGSLIDADPAVTVTVNYLQTTKFNTADPTLITTPYDDTLSLKAGCFVFMQPTPDNVTIPLTSVDPQIAFSVRFSKPMDISKMNPLRTFAILTNTALTTPSAANNFELVVGNIIPSPDLKSFKFVPYLPLPHTSGQQENYRLIVLSGNTGLTDLAGNPLTIPATSFTVNFSLASSAVSNKNRFFNMRFDSLFEGSGPQAQIANHATKASTTEVSGRPVSHFSRDVDHSVPFINAMALFGQGIQTPLSSLGSRLQTVYRHFDANLSINALTDIDLDVEGLHWAPFGATLNVSDFFQHIRIDLSHSKFAPDEFINQSSLLPQWPTSGLSTTSFANNVFEIADHAPGIVYEGTYSVNPNLLFSTSSGSIMMPWPPFTNTYTWRDSTYGSLKFGGPNGNGVNQDQYFFILGQNPPSAGQHPEKPYIAGKVPSVGLPLLMDFRIYPASDPNTKGLNGFWVAIAVTSSSLPSFRVFSTGGLDTNQSPKTVVPDVAPDGTQPTGGYFPPGSTQGTPGTKTSNQGPEVYLGRVDFTTKYSHAYTHFYDFTSPIVTSPVFQNSNTIILPTVQPANTSVKVAFRGATTVSGAGAKADAKCFDAYGDQFTVNVGTVATTIPQPTVSGCGATVPGGLFPPYNPTTPASINFTPNIADLNGKVFIQMRFDFQGDIVNNVTPKMNGFGIAYSGQ
jgi:hypothetical protein